MRFTTIVAYLAHPLAGDMPGNAARGVRWLAHLQRAEPDIAFVAPWLAYVHAGDDNSPRARLRGLRDMTAIAARCDGIVLVGGRISDGMRLELEAVRSAGGWVSDLTAYGEEPPDSAPVPRVLIAAGRSRGAP